MDRKLFVPIECDFFDSPEAIIVGPEGAFAYLRCIAYAKRHLTDGYIPVTAFAQVTGPQWEVTLERLCSVGLLATGVTYKQVDAILVTAYSKHNPTKADVDKIREKNREKVARYRERKSSLPPSNPGVTVSVTGLLPVTDPSVTVSENREQSTENRDIKDSSVGSSVPGYTASVTSYADLEATGGGESGVFEIRPIERARSLLVRGYQRRYEQAANDTWMAVAANSREIDQVAVYVSSQDDPAKAASELLDGFFRDEWAKGARWPWKRLAKDPARYRGATQQVTRNRDKEEYEHVYQAMREAYLRGDSDEGKRLEIKAEGLYARANGVATAAG